MFYRYIRFVFLSLSFRRTREDAAMIKCERGPLMSLEEVFRFIVLQTTVNHVISSE